MNTSVLPHFEACLELYQEAYDQHGTKPFTANRLDWQSPGMEVSQYLDLAVAYGLLSYDGTAYHLTCEPDATEDCWNEMLEDRVSRVKRALPDRSDTDDDTQKRELDSAGLTHNGDEFASVFVEKSDGFDAVADAVGTVDLDDWEGVVLRCPGDYANEVQRFGDRLGNRSELTDTPVSQPLRKEFSDVSGTDKDSLEFRLFLCTA